MLIRYQPTFLEQAHLIGGEHLKVSIETMTIVVSQGLVYQGLALLSFGMFKNKAENLLSCIMIHLTANKHFKLQDLTDNKLAFII